MDAEDEIVQCAKKIDDWGTPSLEQSDAVKRLFEIGTPEALRAIMEHGLKSKSGMVVSDSVRALGDARFEEARAPLTELMKDKQQEFIVRYDAINSLGKIGGREAQDALVNYGLTDGNKGLVLASINALGEMGDADAKKRLQKMEEQNRAQEKPVKEITNCVARSVRKIDAREAVVRSTPKPVEGQAKAEAPRVQKQPL